MKVLQINSVCGYGSTGRITTDLYDVLEEEGHECCIAYGRGTAPKGYNTIKIGNKFDFYCHVLKTRLFDLHGFGSKHATKQLIKKINEYKPDLIQLHNIHGYYLNIEILFNYLSTLSTPVVWLLHDAWTLTGHGAHFDLDEYGEIPLKNLTKKQHKDYPKSLWYDRSKKNLEDKKKIFTKINNGNMTIITPSIWLEKLVLKSYLSKYKVETIYNGIDLNKFKPTINRAISKSINNKKYILGVASVWTETKGLDVFSKLSEELSEEYSIIVVGKIANKFKNSNSKFIHIPRTSNIEELVEIYNLADIYINPTTEDNFPTTNLEALACGTPVITYDTGGSPEAINSETGIVVDKRDYKSLVDEIKKFPYSNYTEKKCVLRSKLFDKKSTFQKYLSLYSVLLSQDSNV